MKKFMGHIRIKTLFEWYAIMRGKGLCDIVSYFQSMKEENNNGFKYCGVSCGLISFANFSNFKEYFWIYM